VALVSVLAASGPIAMASDLYVGCRAEVRNTLGLGLKVRMDHHGLASGRTYTYYVKAANAAGRARHPTA
jgi:hypothetical protein